MHLVSRHELNFVPTDQLLPFLHLMVFMATGISLLEPSFTGLSDLTE